MKFIKTFEQNDSDIDMANTLLIKRTENDKTVFSIFLNKNNEYVSSDVPYYWHPFLWTEGDKISEFDAKIYLDMFCHRSERDNYYVINYLKYDAKKYNL